MINTKKKADEFLKNGNYFDPIRPGRETERYLNSKARKSMLDWCHIGSIDSGSAIIFNIVGAQSINRNLLFNATDYLSVHQY